MQALAVVKGLPGAIGDLTFTLDDPAPLDFEHRHRQLLAREHTRKLGDVGEHDDLPVLAECW
ncbi:hypothetical protein D0Z67_14835 [Streptomyces seoulensis]|uniref:Uncharacterized protein n=1 Tax=Streptomyces seoulensis TaxID=73044 RepID=A0A4P6TV40_STRSO|nr:hypothetical protein D0Z67_14835 [Streptomyces seoulensis]